MDKVLIGLAVAVVLWCIGDAIVRIIKASKSNAGGPLSQKVTDLEADLAAVEQDLDDARERIVVLEKIVNEGNHELRRKIDGLG